MNYILILTFANFSFFFLSCFINKTKIINFVDLKYQKWKQLNKMVAIKHNSSVMIYGNSLKLIFQSYYLSLIQKLTNNVRKIDNNHYEISYIINGKLYKMIVNPKKGPKPILEITNENEHNITEEIMMYYGPNYNWHHFKFTPKFFNHRKIKIKYHNKDDEFIFEEDDYLQ